MYEEEKKVGGDLLKFVKSKEVSMDINVGEKEF